MEGFIYIDDSTVFLYHLNSESKKTQESKPLNYQISSNNKAI